MARCLLACTTWVHLLGVLAAAQATACPIPVFRYAVEYWEPDPYRVTVFHRGGLTPPQARIVDLMHDASRGAGDVPKANLDVNVVDVAEQPHALRRHLDNGMPEPDLPWMTVQFAAINQIEEPLWRGAVTRQDVERLLHSPVRAAAAAKLADGIPVWLFLESGNRRRDNAAFERLTHELRRLEKALELPDPEQWWDERQGVPAPEIRFAAMRLSPNDPEEQFLIRMLVRSEHGLVTRASEPMVFPLYGRGICLWAIVGDGINAWTISEAAEHLVGPCSCQVKMLNPGVDLLIAKHWDAAVQIISDQMLAPIGGMADFEERGREVERRLARETANVVRQRSGLTGTSQTMAEEWANIEDGVPADDDLDALVDRLTKVSRGATGGPVGGRRLVILLAVALFGLFAAGAVAALFLRIGAKHSGTTAKRGVKE